MQGHVEIYSIDEDTKEMELLFEGENLILDSGKETIVDMFTCKILPHEPSGYYDLQRFAPMFFSIGQVREIEVSGGAHSTSSLDSSGDNYATLSALGLSSYATRGPTPKDTKINEPESDLAVFPNYLNFSAEYPEYSHDEMVALGTFLPASGAADGYGGVNQYTLTYQNCINSEGYIYPNSTVYQNRTGLGTEATALYGLQPLASAGGRTPGVNETIYGIHFTGRDIGFLHHHYLGFQYIGLHTMDYYATRDKIGSPDFLTPDGSVPTTKLWTLTRDTNPVMRPFAKKALINGPLLGPYSEFADGNAASVTFSSEYDRRGIVILWRIRWS